MSSTPDWTPISCDAYDIEDDLDESNVHFRAAHDNPALPTFSMNRKRSESTQASSNS